MARARNIKPAFFTNDDLAEIDALGRLLFIGLWTICDYKGDLEWREKRIKAQILPYDDCDIKKLTINLDKSGFVRFYSVQGVLYLNIVNFAKHQNPHLNEKKKGSDIPAPTKESLQVVEIKGLTINLDKSGLKPYENGTDPADSLIPYPDSPILIPDSGVSNIVATAPVKQSKQFKPPVPQAVAQYMTKRGVGFNEAVKESEKLCDFYACKNWMVGKNKMKDWKAATRNWLRNYEPPVSGDGLDHNSTDWINEVGNTL
jgi:hypothetical protein